jgi:hypothetical protein
MSDAGIAVLKENLRTLKVVLESHKGFFRDNHWGANRATKAFENYLKDSVEEAQDKYVRALEGL